jgi:hypothetical protein
MVFLSVTGLKRNYNIRTLLQQHTRILWVLGGSRIRASAVVSDSTVNARGTFNCCFFDSEA